MSQCSDSHFSFPFFLLTHLLEIKKSFFPFFFHLDKNCAQVSNNLWVDLTFLTDATVSDSLRDHNGSKFRTWDQKHSICPEKVGESWWFPEVLCYSFKSKRNLWKQRKRKNSLGKIRSWRSYSHSQNNRNENQTCRIQTARREADKTRNNERKGVMVKERVHIFPERTLICFLNFSCISRNLRFWLKDYCWCH